MRWFWMIFLTMTLAFGAISVPSGAIEAAKNNPALLNTPQAQAIMKKEGISKDQALKLIKEKSKQSSTTPVKAEAKQQITAPAPQMATMIRNASTFTGGNPLHYVNTSQLLQRIKKLQQKRVGTKGLKYFGYSFFTNANTFNPAIFPTPEYYILTPGDVLLIETYGSSNKQYQLRINNNGNVMIPVIGPVHVAGKTFGRVKKELATIIAKTFPGIKASINIQKFTTIQVFLTGDAAAPGIYNVPALSTVQTLLVQSRGVLPTGSLRKVEIYRNGKKLATVDLYGLLTGHPGKEPLLRAGDIVHIPHAYKKVAIYGEIKKAAIYELKPNEKGKDLLRYAGGLTPKASADAITVKRYDNHQHWKTYRLNLQKFNRFNLRDGDEIIVYPMAGLQQKNVYFFGNVVKPGPRALPKNDASLHDLLHKESDKGLDRLFLPDTYFQYAFIKRLGKDMQEHIIGFDLLSVYNGQSDVTLQNEDEIYFLNQYEVLGNQYVTIQGHVLRPGLYRYLDGLTLNDLITAAGYLLIDDNVRITTYETPDFLPKTMTVNFRKNPDFKLHPFDEVYVFDYYETHVIAKAQIAGQVVKPGQYAIQKGMTLGELIAAAGGLKEKASQKGEIVRFSVKNGERVRHIIPISLDDDGLNQTIENHDIVTIFQIPKWNELKRVTLKGEVKYPGTYVIKDDETLADVIERAGGFNDSAFLEGAVFTRESVKRIQRAQLKQALQRMKKRAMVVASRPADFGHGQVPVQDVLTSIDAVIKQAEKVKPIGRITLHLVKDPQKLRKSHSNIVLKNGDTLYVPTKNDTVTVLGEVLNPTAMVYDKSLNAWDYIEKAGGLSDNANKDTIYVVHANGEAQRLSAGSFFVSDNVKIKPGDTIVVPIYIPETSNMQIAKDATQVIYQIAVSVAALSGIGAL